MYKKWLGVGDEDEKDAWLQLVLDSDEEEDDGFMDERKRSIEMYRGSFRVLSSIGSSGARRVGSRGGLSGNSRLGFIEVSYL
ncbi:unnamed protein product [Dovyalis caffra]|uniref:Uncharacterized protein n=1 Tax=Dovyalis caffra TaxID=77055 RepID=A0AAV1SL29_9ROSI|nr:unnamed protein product [Dovyalis caffra]